MLLFLSVIVLGVCADHADASSVHEIYKSANDLNLALIFNKCENQNYTTPYRDQSLINSAIWTTERINFLELAAPLDLGLFIFKTCSEKENLQTIFQLFNSSEDFFLLGVISENKFSSKVAKFCEVLDIGRKTIYKVNKYMVKSSVYFLSSMGWNDNVTIIVSDEDVIEEFFVHSSRKFICVKENFVWNQISNVNVNLTSDTIVFFGNLEEIYGFVRQYEEFLIYNNVLIIPLDGSVPRDLPENSFVLIPPHDPISRKFKKTESVPTTPQLFNIAGPIISFAQVARMFIKENCNESFYKLNCLRNKFRKASPKTQFSPIDITEILKIEPLIDNFNYHIYKVENMTFNITELPKKNNFLQPYTKVFSFNVISEKWFIENFTEQITDLNETRETCKEKATYCIDNCKNFMQEIREGFYKKTIFSDVIIRSDSWVYAFLSLSVLGILFCIAILSFIFISICRRDILEGNPALTIILLISVLLMFLAVLPFCLDVTNKSLKETICLLKSLTITLTYALAFSLILSRSILLASAAKEIGFMSHIAGPVQSFLCLFIFGVQAALSLQIVGKCLDIFKGYYFLYLMSYNVMLLLLLLCLCPLIYKCQRNYREGKYFTIAIVLTATVWCVWLPCYACLGRQWKEPILCFGVVSTASIFLGSIFIPRTYLMTIAAARDKITSRLPSLATATSAMDIYRANTQPVYDCVNVAAINAVNVARAGVVGTTMQQPDLYSCPALPDDDDIDFRCDTPLSNDKVTRF